MGIRTHRTKAIAAAASAALIVATVAVSAAAPAQAATSHTVKVKMSDSSITFSGGGSSTANGVTTLHAGRYHFHVVSHSGDHILQLIRFKNGYTAQDAQGDFGKAFSGDVDAVQRLDNGVVFRGGADAKPQHPGDMVVVLKAGPFMAIDQNGNAVAQIAVVGHAASTPLGQHTGTYTAFSYGWGVSKHLPAAGTVKVTNQADQPHFLVLQRVKDSTTTAQVRKFIKSGARGNPTWGLRASADSGVISPGTSQLMSYDLPAGKYFIACFWPDYFTGMPHFLMGMWKLVTIG
jgi:hypothetical protein